MLRRIEWVSGLLAGGLGIFAWTYVMSGPLYSTASTTSDSAGNSTTTYGSATLAQVGMSPQAMLFLVAMLLCLIGVIVGAYLHGRHGVGTGLILLCVSALLLLSGVVISLFSIGLLLAPAALLALFSAVAAVIETGRTRTARREA